MRLGTTQGNENPHRRRPRKSGDPWWVGTKMDSRLRGNDESGRDFQESQARNLHLSILHDMNADASLRSA